MTLFGTLMSRSGFDAVVAEDLLAAANGVIRMDDGLESDERHPAFDLRASRTSATETFSRVQRSMRSRPSGPRSGEPQRGHGYGHFGDRLSDVRDSALTRAPNRQIRAVQSRGRGSCLRPMNIAVAYRSLELR